MSFLMHLIGCVRETIKRAMETCEASGYETSDHFANVGKMIKLAKGAEREVEDFMLTRYACYIIVTRNDKEVYIMTKKFLRYI